MDNQGNRIIKEKDVQIRRSQLKYFSNLEQQFMTSLIYLCLIIFERLNELHFSCLAHSGPVIMLDCSTVVLTSVVN